MSGVGRLGINPDAYGVWRADDPDATPWRQFLDSAAEIGFTAVELGPAGYLPEDPAQLQTELASRGLELTCGYLPIDFSVAPSPEDLRDRLAAVAQATAGARYVLALARARWGPTGRVVPDGEHWRAIVDGLVHLAAVARDVHDMELVFHAHVGMAVETVAEIDRFIEDTDGSVSLVLDVGQLAYVGGDSAAFLRDHAALVSYLHLRDLDPEVRDRCVADGADFAAAAARDVFCEPGTGCVDLAAVAAAAAEVGFTGPAIVERSYLGRTPTEAVAAARRAFTTYRELGFG